MHLRLKFGQFFLLHFQYLVFKSHYTHCCADYCAVLPDRFVTEVEHVLESLQCEPTHRIGIVVIQILIHVLSMHSYVPELFQRLSIVAI